MMAPVKVKNFISTVVGGGLSAANIEATLASDAVVVSGFKESLAWDSTRAQLTSSPELADVMVASPALFELLYSNKAMWSDLSVVPTTIDAVATTTDAVVQLRASGWAWSHILKNSDFIGSVFNRNENLEALTVDELIDDLTWDKVTESENALDWLYALDDERAKGMFDDADTWTKTSEYEVSLAAFSKNAVALTHALDTDPAKYAGSDPALLLPALSNNPVAADTIHSLPGRFDAIGTDHWAVRRTLHQQPPLPFLFSYCSYIGTHGSESLKTVDEHGNLLWALTSSVRLGTVGLPDNSGWVTAKRQSPLYSGADETVVFEHYTWAGGLNPVATIEGTFAPTTNPVEGLSVSPNGRYIGWCDRGTGIVIDMTTFQIVTEHTIVGHTPLAQVVDNNGQLYIGDNDDGRVFSVALGGTAVAWDVSLAGIAQHTKTLCAEASGTVLVGFDQSDKLCRIDSSGTLITEITLTASLRAGQGHIVPDPTRGGYYLLSITQPYVSYLTSAGTHLSISTTSSHRPSSVNNYVDASGMLHYVYNTYKNTADYTNGVTMEGNAHYWMYDSVGGGASFMGHPTERLAVADDPGVCPLNALEEPVVDGWVPSSCVENAGTTFFLEAFPGELVAYHGNYIKVMDPMTGLVTRAYRPPFMGKVANTSNVAVRPTTHNVYPMVRLAPTGERVYSSRPYTYQTYFMNADGTVRWSSSNLGSEGVLNHILMHPLGRLILVSGHSQVVEVDPQDGTLLNTVNYTADHAGPALGLYGESLIIGCRAGRTGRFYTTHTNLLDISEDSNNYLGGIATVYAPFSTSTRVESQGILDDHFYSCITSSSSSYDPVIRMTRMAPYDKVEYDTFDFTEAWLNQQGVSGTFPDAVVYDGNEDCIYLISRYEMIKVIDWRLGESGASVTDIVSLPGDFSVGRYTNYCSTTGAVDNNAW